MKSVIALFVLCALFVLYAFSVPQLALAQSQGYSGGGGAPVTSVTMTGDDTGPSSANVVSKINGTSVPAGGSLTLGNVLQATGGATSTWGPLNLAGGAGYITGLLPSTSQVSQTMGGDVSGTTAASVVNQSSGTGTFTYATALVNFLSTVTSPTIGQATRASDLAPNNLTVQAQNAFATASTHTTGANLVLQGGLGATSNAIYAPGNVVVNVGVPSTAGTNEAGLQLQRSGTVIAEIQLIPTIPTYTGVFLGGSGGVTPSSTNYILASNLSNAIINGPSGVEFAVAGTVQHTLSSGVEQWGAGISTPKWIQTIPTTDVATQAFTIQAQSAFATASTNVTGGNLVLQAGAGATSNATFTSGNVVAEVNAPNSGGTEAYFQINRGGTVLGQLGAAVGTVSDFAIYGPGVTPSSSDYLLAASSSNAYLNAPSQVNILVANNQYLAFASSLVQFAQPIGGFSTNAVRLSENGSALACGTGGTQTISTSQAPTPGIPVTSGVLTSACTIAFGTNASSGIFWLDLSAVTSTDLATFPITITNGTASFNITGSVITAMAAAAKTGVTVQTHGTNTLALY
jgi:hypothetical protein